MASLIIPLIDILIDPKSPVDLTTVSLAEAIEQIRNSYGFLATEIDVKIEGGIVTISLEDVKQKKFQEASDWYDRGVRKANQADYKGAIKLFQQVLAHLPLHTDARRNLAMAFLELGDHEEALNQLIDVLRINPKDVWAYILVGNIYVKNKKDYASAESFYKKAMEIDPKDPYLLNNYAALKAEKGDLLAAEQMFRQSIEINPGYLNSSLGLVLLLQNQSRYSEAIAILEILLAKSLAADPQNKSINMRHRVFLYELHKKNADEQHESLLAFAHARGNVIEQITGYPVEFIEDDSLKSVTAKSVIAWKHKIPAHQVIYRPQSIAILPHIMIHELEHILLEHEARRENRNKVFVATEQNKRYAEAQISSEIQKLRTIFTEEELCSVKEMWINGIVNQLYNLPLDMIIEKRIFDKYPSIRSSQFVSLQKTMTDNASVLSNPEIQKTSPRSIYRMNTAMNGA